MKIGIMSMQRVQNYGSFLQAYGLKKVIEDMGHTVQFVDYLPEKSVIPEQKISIAARMFRKCVNFVRLLSPAYRKWRSQQIYMNRTFSEFCHAYDTDFLPLLQVDHTPDISPELDVLIIGSDEVFNCTQPGNTVGFSRQLFGKDHRAKKLISYAASFGSTTMQKLNAYHIDGEVGELLKQFDAISVRDEHSAQMVRQLTARTPLQHMDPVLVYDFPEVADIKIERKDYIVVYAYADRLNKDEIAAVKDFAKKNNKKILSLGFYQPFCDEYVLVSPLETLAYMKHADYVVTDTFHGTVFSLKYQKNFATIIRESNKEKLTGLLKVFGAENRCVTNLQELEDILEKSLSPDVPNMIASEQLRAKAYLTEHLQPSERC